MQATESPTSSSEVARIGPVSFIIKHNVRADSRQIYEDWLKEINTVSRTYPGHLGVHVTLPVETGGHSREYNIVVRFEDSHKLEKWIKSDDRARLIAKIQPILIEGECFTIKSGLDFWFTPESANAKLPSRWKQALLTWSAIFPLVMFVPVLMKPILNLTGPLNNHTFNTLVVTGTIVYLMTYIVMPNYTKLVQRWLFR